MHSSSSPAMNGSRDGGAFVKDDEGMGLPDVGRARGCLHSFGS